MRAVAQDRYGGREVLALRDLPKPPLAAGELRVAVKAAAAQPSDWIISVRGVRASSFLYAVPTRRRAVDFSGVVTEVGAGRDGLRPGR